MTKEELMVELSTFKDLFNDRTKYIDVYLYNNEHYIGLLTNDNDALYIDELYIDNDDIMLRMGRLHSIILRVHRIKYWYNETVKEITLDPQE